MHKGNIKSANHEGNIIFTVLSILPKFFAKKCMKVYQKTSCWTEVITCGTMYIVMMNNIVTLLYTYGTMNSFLTAHYVYHLNVSFVATCGLNNTVIQLR